MSQHTILLLALEVKKKIGLSFWITILLFQHCQLVVTQARNWFYFQLWVEMILHLDQDCYPKSCLRATCGMILCSLPSSVVSCFVGVCLSTDSFNQFKLEYEIKIFTHQSRFVLLWIFRVSPVCGVSSSQFVMFLRYQGCRFNQVVECLTLVRRLVLVVPVCEVVLLIYRICSTECLTDQFVVSWVWSAVCSWCLIARVS